MTEPRPGFLRQNAFLVAGVALPVIVAGFFIIATAIPRWTVAAPAYDMVLRAARPYDPSPSKVTVDFTVRNGQVEATVRPAAPNTYTPTWALFRFDHETMNVREIPLELPDSLSDGESRTIRVEALAGSRITADAAAPDGYSLNTSSSGGTGLVGDIFGMSRYRRNLSLINRGRMVPLELPSPFQDPYASEVFGVGWVIGPVQGS